MNSNISLQDYKNENSFLKAFKDDIRSVPEILEDNLEKGLIDQDLYDTAIGQYIDILEKGGKKAQVGEIREFGGKKYIKTKTGPNSWRPYSPGGNYEHLTGGEKKESMNPDKFNSLPARVYNSNQGKKGRPSVNKEATQANIDKYKGDSGKEEKREVKDTSVLPEPSTSKISSAINSYKHSEDTVKEIQAHIDYHQKVYDSYRAEMKKLDASKSKEDWDNYFKVKDRAQPHINAVLAFKMAKAASEILQQYKADKGIGLSDTSGQMSLFSDARTLLNRALSYKKEAKEKAG